MRAASVRLEAISSVVAARTLAAANASRERFVSSPIDDVAAAFLLDSHDLRQRERDMAGPIVFGKFRCLGRCRHAKLWSFGGLTTPPRRAWRLRERHHRSFRDFRRSCGSQSSGGSSRRSLNCSAIICSVRRFHVQNRLFHRQQIQRRGPSLQLLWLANPAAPRATRRRRRRCEDERGMIEIYRESIRNACDGGNASSFACRCVMSRLPSARDEDSRIPGPSDPR